MVQPPPKAFLSWSSGKDSAYALLEAHRLGIAQIVGVLTVVAGSDRLVSMHGVREAVLDRQIAALGLPAIKVEIPDRCSNEVYEARMATACEAMKAAGVAHLVFGDLFLADIRAYREDRLARIGMGAIFPLWERNTRELAEAMVESGLEARLVCVDRRRLDPSFAGRRFDRALLRDLPAGIDPCGENGEFHTLVTAGPMFAAPVDVIAGGIVERDGFAFADMRLRD